MSNTPSFIGLNPRWFKWDQLFRVYITHDRLCGAFLAGQIQDEQSASAQLQGLFLFAWPYVRRIVQRRADRESMYDEIDPTSQAFLDADQRNFHIERRHVVGCSVSHKRRLWTPNNTGTVNLALSSGIERHFILVGEQRPNAVADMLTVFYPDICETDTSYT